MHYLNSSFRQKIKPISCVILVLVMIISMCDILLPVNADNNIADADEKSFFNDSSPKNGTAIDSLANNDEICDMTSFFKDYQTELYSCLTINKDGTYTQDIYNYPIKYKNEKGEVIKKTLDIKAVKNDIYPFQTANNDVITKFGATLDQGINLNYKDYNILIVPQRIISAKALYSEKEKSIFYDIDENTSYKYSLTYMGYKEDIILKEYKGVSDFYYTLYTGGLIPEIQTDELILVDDMGNQVASLGDVLVLSADEKFNSIGKISCETVKNNQEYLIGIHVDEAYLADERVKYPITIDPSVVITKTDTSAGVIEDALISETITYRGTYGSLYIGRNANGVKHRALMRFPGLEIEGASVDSAYVYLRDLICQSAATTIECHQYTGNPWTESGTTTWSSVGNNTVGYLISDKSIHGGGGNYPSGSNWYAYDITSIAEMWANGTADPELGLIFKATDAFESGAVNTYKTFASINRAAYNPSIRINYTVAPSVSDITVGLNQTQTTQLDTFGIEYWGVGDTDIATISGTNTIQGNRIGTTNLLGYYHDENNTLVSINAATIHVVIPDGIYYMATSGSHMYAHVEYERILNNQNVSQLGTEGQYPTSYSTDPSLQQLASMWRIKYHISSNSRFYTISSMLDNSLFLTKDGSNVKIANNNETYIPNKIKWNIEYADYYSYYNIYNGSSYNSMSVASETSAPNENIGCRSYSGEGNQRWSLTRVNYFPKGLMLYDIYTGHVSYDTAPTYINIGETEYFMLTDIRIMPYGIDYVSIKNINYGWHTNNQLTICIQELAFIGVSCGTVNVSAVATGYSTCHSHHNITVRQMPDNEYYFYNAETGKVIDLEGPPYDTDGGYVHQWDIHNNLQCEWELERTVYNCYTIKSLKSGMYMAVQNNYTQAGSKIIQQESDDTDNCLWRICINPDSDSGNYQLVPYYGISLGLALSVDNLSSSNGALLYQYVYTNDSNYKDEWNIEQCHHAQDTSFIINAKSAYVLSDDNNSLTMQEELDADAPQKWLLTYLGNHYYTIKNTDSNLYLTTPDTTDNNALITEEAYSSNIAQRQIWKIYRLQNNYYEIQAKVRENTNLRISQYSGALVQKYSNDYDEWAITFDGNESFLLSINDTETGHDHISVYSYVMNGLVKAKDEECNLLKANSVNTSQVLDYLDDCEVFICRTHGRYEAGAMSGILLSRSAVLYADDIYDFTRNEARIDLQNIKLVILVACETSRIENGVYDSIADAMHNAGAEVVIGFNDKINCNDANEWLEKFMEEYNESQNPHIAYIEANSKLYKRNITDNRYIN